MIVHILPFLNSLRIVLASASPRRIQLLRTIGLTNITVLPSTFPETLPHSQHTPSSYVVATARAKAVEVYERCAGQCDLLIAADTIVVSEDGRILEKPKDAADAVRILSALSGRTHSTSSQRSCSSDQPHRHPRPLLLLRPLVVLGSPSSTASQRAHR